MYKAIVAEVITKPHPNADNLQLGLIRGNQVVIGKDVKDGDLMVFFPADGQLTSVFCEAHDLISRMDADGKKAGGYFAKNRRVRAQNFRGEKSDGFAMSVSCLEFTGINVGVLEDGFEFDTINGVLICQKYYTPATQNQNANKSARKKKIAPFFKEHFETVQLGYEINKIPSGAVLYITEKLHGTSHRVGNTLIELELNLFQKLWNKFPLPKFPTRMWKVLHGSRRVVLGDLTSDGYYKTDFRQRATGWLGQYLRKGETLYLEIVGWADETHSLMPFHNTDALKDKKISKIYGKEMRYLYGNQPGQCSVYVYRITMTNEDGIETELSWNQVIARCKELGINPVPMLAKVFYDGDVDNLLKNADELAMGGSSIDQTHIKEGICVRIEHPDYFNILKYKSFVFKVMEGIAKDDDNAVDLEEVS